MRYTQTTSKFGNLTRRRPEFEPGLPAPKQLNLNKLSDAGGFKCGGSRRSQKPNFGAVCVCTQTTSKFGNLTRRRPEFEPGLPAPKQLNLNKLSDAGGFKCGGSRRGQKPNFEAVCVYLIFFFFIALAGCSSDQNGSLTTSFFHEGNKKPTVCILQMEDLAHTPFSEALAHSCTSSLIERLAAKRQLDIHLSKHPERQFLVSMQLMPPLDASGTSYELMMSIHLKIFDLRREKPQIILQEVIPLHLLLGESAGRIRVADMGDETFKVSPIGLAQSKAAREIAMRIEDYILLVTKG
jgi:hypothetical protein